MLENSDLEMFHENQYFFIIPSIATINNIVWTGMSIILLWAIFPDRIWDLVLKSDWKNIYKILIVYSLYVLIFQRTNDIQKLQIKEHNGYQESGVYSDKQQLFTSFRDDRCVHWNRGY